MQPKTTRMDQTTSTNLFDLNIDDQSSGYLSETAKWAKFFAVLGFIGCGFMVLFALFAGTVFSTLRSTTGTVAEMSMLGGAFFSIFCILFALLYFFPCLYLFRFGSRMQAALRNNEQPSLAESFRNLKACFRFIGILTIVVSSIYILFFLFAIIFSIPR
jgi:hypothetical protein